MPRNRRVNLTVAAAGDLVGGEPRLRLLARTRQLWNMWKMKGVPWEVIGPLILARLLEQCSLSSSLRSHDASQPEGDQMAHIVLAAQGRVFQLASTYGVDSKEFRMLLGVLDTFLDTPRARVHSAAAGVHSVGAPKRRVKAMA